MTRPSKFEVNIFIPYREILIRMKNCTYSRIMCSALICSFFIEAPFILYNLTICATGIYHQNCNYRY